MDDLNIMQLSEASARKKFNISSFFEPNCSHVAD